MSNSKPDEYKVIYSPATCKYIRRDDDIDTITRVVISTVDNVEIRQIEIKNNRDKEANIDILSYVEPIITKQDSDIIHPAFSDLFLYVNKHENSCIVERKMRNNNDEKIFYIHFALNEENIDDVFELETNKTKFIGRERSMQNPIAVIQDKIFINDAKLNPNTVVAFKKNIKIMPNTSSVISFIYGITNEKEQAFNLYKKYSSPENIDRVFELAISRSLIENRFLGYKAKNIYKYNDILTQIIEGSNSRKKYEKEIMKNNLKQKDLWKFGISGELPIITVRIKGVNETEIIKELLFAEEYFNRKNIKIDLVILNEEENSYEEYLKDKIYEITSVNDVNYLLNTRGGVHIIKTNHITEDEINLLYACSDIIFDSQNGLLEEQLYENG